MDIIILFGIILSRIFGMVEKGKKIITAKGTRAIRTLFRGSSEEEGAFRCMNQKWR
jgi:hypothetical protein